MKVVERQREIEKSLASSPTADRSHDMQSVGIVGRGVKFLPSGEVSDRVIVTFSLCRPTGKEELSEGECILIERIEKAIVAVLESSDLPL